MPPQISFTLILIILTVIVSMAAESKPGLKAKLLLNPYLADTQKQYYRFLTSGFVHNGWPHLLFNMFTFYFFAGYVERSYSIQYGTKGILYFFLLYLAGIVVSDIPTFLKHKHNFYYNSLGASGGVSAVLFASILMAPLNKVCLYGFICFPGFIWGAIYLIYTYWQGKKGEDNINHDAHLYGAIFGVLFSIALNPGVVLTFLSDIMLWLGSF